MKNPTQGSVTQIIASGTQKNNILPDILPEFEPNKGRRDVTAQVRGNLSSSTPQLDYQTSQPSQQKPPHQRPLDNIKENLGEKPRKAAPGRQKTPAEDIGHRLQQTVAGLGDENADLDAIQARFEARQIAIKLKSNEQLERWVMLDSARNLLNDLPDGKKHSTATCMRIHLPTRVTGLERGQVEVKYTTGHDGQGRARYGNLGRCGSVWACPVCAYRIAQQRAAEVQTVLQSHMAEGGRLMFATLTHRGGRGDTAEKLSTQLKKQTKALKTMQETYKYKQLLKNNGVLGMIRSLEITYSHAQGGGWHVHIHALLLLAGSDQQARRHAAILSDMDRVAAQRAIEENRAPRQRKTREAVGVPDVAALPQFGLDFCAAWQSAAKKAGLYAAPDAQQCVIAADDTQSLDKMAQYLTKCDWDGEKQRWVGTGQDNTEHFGGSDAHRAAVGMVEAAGQTTGSSNAALEAVGGVHKKGRAESFSPMQMLRDFALNGVANGKNLTGEELAQQKRAHQHGILWREYALDTKGQRALVWGAGLRAMYALEDEETQQEKEEKALSDIEKQLCLLEGDDWKEILAARRGTRGELLKIAAETGNPDEVLEFVERVRQRNRVARKLKNKNNHQNPNGAGRSRRRYQQGKPNL